MQQVDVFTLFQEQDFVFNKPVDINDCDREPIHIPGSVQPHGVLLVLDEKLHICQLSANAAAYLGKDSKDLLNRSLQELLSPESVGLVRDKINTLTYQQNFKVTVAGIQESCEAILHRNEHNMLVLEIEACQGKVNEITLTAYSEIIQRLQHSEDIKQLCMRAAEAIKSLTGFDRVMVYKFHADGSGEVVAEELEHHLAPYFGLHFPATDIPKQARIMYLHNPIRLIPYVDYEAVPLQPALNPVTRKPLNLSLSTLRSVSPIHIQYLKNMGVKASMSVSIVRNGRLWGLFACHHYKPYHVPYAQREACYLLGRSFSTMLHDKLQGEEDRYLSHIREVQAKLYERMSQAEHYSSSLHEQNPTIKDLIECTGCAICFGEEYYAIGDTPSEEQLRALTTWLQKKDEGHVFNTRALSEVYPEAAAYKEKASGLLAITVSRTQGEYILWFRPEVLETVKWAGRPDKAMQLKEDGSKQLAPRQSFSAWAEQVEGTSLPWKPVEEQAVREMRGILVDVVMRVSGELKLRAGILSRLNRELERSNNELDSFAYIASHDLKEPLRGIHNYSQFLLEDYFDKLDAGGKEKLKTLMRLSVRMEQLLDSLLHYSRVGRTDIHRKSVDLNKVIEEAKDVLRQRLEARQVRISVPDKLPVVYCDRLQMMEVYQNLIANAIKYNNNEEVQIEIGYQQKEEPLHKKVRTVFYVKDNGIGIEERHHEVVFNIFRRLHARQAYEGGSGVGLTIVKKVVERHGGEIWLVSEPGSGTTFYFTLEDENLL